MAGKTLYLYSMEIPSRLFDLQHNTSMQDRHGREIVPSEDVYPPPLMTSRPSQKVIGNDRLWFALAYLRVDRLKELLILNGYLSETDDFHKQVLKNVSDNDRARAEIYHTNPRLEFETTMKLLRNLKEEQTQEYITKYNNAVDFRTEFDSYKQNVFHILVSENSGANLMFGTFQASYAQMLYLCITLLPKPAIIYLLDQEDCFGRKPIEEALRNGEYAFALALIDNGSPIPRDNRIVNGNSRVPREFYDRDTLHTILDNAKSITDYELSYVSQLSDETMLYNPNTKGFRILSRHPFARTDYDCDFIIESDD